jgi:hypothetical protein
MGKKKPLNAWGEEIGPIQKDRFWVPPAERKDTDEGEGTDALGDGGDDMEGWEPPR